MSCGRAQPRALIVSRSRPQKRSGCYQMAGLRVFVDMFSQPSRAVLILLEANKIPYETCLLKIGRGEHMTDEYKKINPTRKVPAIDDGGFCLFESGAIMRYLVQKYRLPDHWYPSDPQRRAKIDEFLDWHHQNLRVGAAHTLFQKLFAANLLGKEPDQERIEETTMILHKSEKLLENYFLKETKFINSQDISIADLQALCEFTQFWVGGVDPFKEKPRLAQWMEDCKEELHPHLDTAHKMIYVVKERGTYAGKL